MDTTTVDPSFHGRFYPSYIKVPFLAWDRPWGDVNRHDEFKACTECGHLWGSVDPVQLKAALEKCEWDGKPQVMPKEQKSYFWPNSFSIIAVLYLLLVIYFLG